MKYIKGYDGLRAISILLVILTHLNLYSFLPENSLFQTRIWKMISGETGVWIFFNLSGFLITSILLNERKNQGYINFKRFFLKRFIRLLPAVIILYIIVIVLSQFNLIELTIQGFFLSLLYLYNYVPVHYYHDEIAHTWSLAVEEQYYLIWPFIIQYLFPGKILKVCAILLSLCVLLLITQHYITFEISYKPERWFLPSAAPIVLGSIAAFFISSNNDTFVSWFKNKKGMRWGIFLFLYPLYSPAFLLYLTPIFLSMGISLIIAWIYFHQESKVTSMLNNKTLSYLGKISYGVYVYQGVFLKTGPGSDLFIQQFPQNVILTAITAILSFELIEKRFLLLKKKI
jgi:peptidoglycan/LPS O-acetylase OafA/YrhL